MAHTCLYIGDSRLFVFMGFFTRNTHLGWTDSVAVGILLVDFVALAVAAGTVYFAARVAAATSTAVEILFDLAQTWATIHSDFVNGYRELENKPNIVVKQFYNRHNESLFLCEMKMLT